ncbi:MAG: hypothetical protein RL235_317 [Chlamydiota bacterium]|jgi:hypothetical protein
MRIPFFTPIKAHQPLQKFVEGYFYLNGKVAVPISKEKSEVWLYPNKQKWYITALKVASYFTVVLPLIMLIAKIILRTTHNYTISAPAEIRNPPWGGESPSIGEESAALTAQQVEDRLEALSRLGAPPYMRHQDAAIDRSFLIDPASLHVECLLGQASNRNRYYAFPIGPKIARPGILPTSMTFFQIQEDGKATWYIRASFMPNSLPATARDLDQLSQIINRQHDMLMIRPTPLPAEERAE